jgi:hypothetical protein
MSICEWLAARLTVVTRNTGEFAAAGVAIVNPWKDPIRPCE